jgi:hypothetical protein
MRILHRGPNWVNASGISASQPLTAWHRLPIALLPARTPWVTRIHRARGFYRHHNIFPFSRIVTIEPAAGVEDRRKDQDDQDAQDDTGGKACPGRKLVDRVRPLPSRRIGRIGLRGRRCRFVLGLRCLGRTFITRHAAVLPYNRVSAAPCRRSVRTKTFE